MKKARLAILKKYDNFTFHKVNIANRKAMESLFGGQFKIQNSELETRGSSVTRHASRVTGSFDTVIHLAAQAGVRYSITNPHAYIDSNIVGFINILEGSRHSKVKHLVYASSSSVYGANTRMPFSIHHNIDHPV